MFNRISDWAIIVSRLISLQITQSHGVTNSDNLTVPMVRNTREGGGHICRRMDACLVYQVKGDSEAMGGSVREASPVKETRQLYLLCAITREMDAPEGVTVIW